MPRIYLTSGGVPVYTVEQAVGAGCPNRAEDVMLVQFFLRTASDGWSSYVPSGQPLLACDGHFGPVTRAYLQQFIVQQNKANPHQLLSQDGRVDPITPGRSTGSISGNLYTILAMNMAYGKLRGKDGLQDITLDKCFPAALWPFLKI